MKKTLFMLISSILIFWITQADILDDSISWMYDNELTIHQSQNTFNANKSIRRDEAAKFFVKFAKKLNKTTYIKNYNQCIFSDINNSWSDLQDIVVESCMLWLFQWNRWKFYPQNQITNAEAITVLIRLIYWFQNEIWVNHRSDNYYKKANELNILQNVYMDNKNTIASRGNVWIIIYNANNIFNCTPEWEDFSVAVGPQYYKPCCTWLIWEKLDWDWELVIGWSLTCIDPNKWTPQCKDTWPFWQWRYYPNGSFLKSDLCF